MDFKEIRETCGNREETPDSTWRDRTGAGIIPGGSARCTLLIPAHWPKTEMGDAEMARRWLGSGGGPEVFAPCSCESCPRLFNHHPDHRAIAEEDRARWRPAGP